MGGRFEDEISTDPFEQFGRWYDDALASDHPEPNAMALATVNASGQPSVRMVLLKGFDASGFVFYSNYRSRKAGELDQNPHAAFVLFWSTLHRQIRVEGWVEKVSAEGSDAYFAGRARGSQLAAAASPQSAVIDSRAELEARVATLTSRYEGGMVPRPDHWGGYRVAPHTIEFWQGRPNRLHDRIRFYRDGEGSWCRERLAP